MPRLSRIPPFVAALLLAACDATPTAPSTRAFPSLAVEGGPVSRAVEEHLYDFDAGDTYTQVECADGTVSEPIVLFGKVHEKITLLHDAVGGLHVSVQEMPVGFHGVGRETGMAYRIAERAASTTLQRESAISGAFRSVLTIVGERGGPRYEIVSHGHYRLDADGVPVVEWERARLECR